MVRVVTSSELTLSEKAGGSSAPAAGVRFGVVIPCRGDELVLPHCLASLSEFSAAKDTLVVVNSDNSPETSAIAVRAGVEVIRSAKPERGWAIAAGVSYLQHSAAAGPDVILVAHADMEFTAGSRQALLAHLGSNPRRQWGALGHQIMATQWKYRVIEFGNRIRASRWQMPYGDQAMFFGVGVLAAVGGFPQQNQLEDCELSLRFRPLAPPLYVDYPVRISNRHWRRGVVATSVRNWFIAINYLIVRVESHAVNAQALTEKPVAI